MIRDGLVDRTFVAARTEGFDAVAELVAAYTPENVEEITGVPAADIERGGAPLRATPSAPASSGASA